MKGRTFSGLSAYNIAANESTKKTKKKMPLKCFLPRLAKRVIVKVHKISALYRYILLTLARLVNNKLSLVES